MGDRRVMCSTRLANLHHREVEAEGLHLPLKLEEFTVRRALQPIGGEARTKFTQLVDELLWRCVAAYLGAPLNTRATGARNALRDGTESASIRLIGESV